MAVSPKETVAGEWDCTATQDGDSEGKTAFRMMLRQAGGRVTGESAFVPAVRRLLRERHAEQFWQMRTDAMRSPENCKVSR